MPENDPLESLDNFPEGLHVNSLPASEVRRRGDRMRRRNTALATVGGVVAAAVFIGTPVALLSGNNDRDDVDPAPQPTPTVTEDAPPTWLAEIPADFPVTEGMVTGDGKLAEGGTDALNLCDTAYPTSRGTEVTQTWSYSDDGESYVRRTFQLWPDDSSAEESLTGLIEAIEACPQQPTAGGEDIIKTQHVPFDLGGDDSVTFVQQIEADDGLISQLTTVEVTRVGNAVLVSSSYGSAGGDEAIGIATQILADASATTRGAMCVFSADPCSTTELTPDPENSEAPPPVEGSTAAIPADFPLTSGFPDVDSDSTVTGPGPDVEAIPEIDLCGTPAWSPTGVAERLAVLRTGPEFADARELVTFTSVDEAIAAVAEVESAVAACPERPGGEGTSGYENRVLDVDTGYETFTWGAFARTALDGGVFQLTRVGYSVLVVYAAGEMSESSLQPAAKDLTVDTKAIAPAMCVFTQDGC